MVHSNNYDLTGYDGQTVHIALVYKGTFAQAWGVLSMEIRAKEDPVIPIFAHLSCFPVTALGESSSKKVYYQNVGAGNLSADITYPASMTGPASITDLAPGVLDSMVVTYTPSTAGIELGDIVVDGSASGAAVVSLGVEANAGELAFDMVSRNAGWKQYSLEAKHGLRLQEMYILAFGDGGEEPDTAQKTIMVSTLTLVIGVVLMTT